MAAERERHVFDDLVGNDDDVAIAAVTAAELLVGVELAKGARRKARQRYVEAILATVGIESYDLDCARMHSTLLVHARRSGRTRGAHDLLIAATALARGRTVVTSDSKGFGDLPGLLFRSP